jgi:plastocyanin
VTAWGGADSPRRPIPAERTARFRSRNPQSETSMRLRLLILASLAAAGTLVACGGSTPAVSAPASANTVDIKNFAFGPATLRVPTGATVTWTNSDATAHTTTSDKTDGETWDSANLATNTSYAVTFAKAGTYTYHCDIHNYMTGTIVVG